MADGGAILRRDRAGDVDAVIATFAPDAELLSPLIGRAVFRGHDDLAIAPGPRLARHPAVLRRSLRSR